MKYYISFFLIVLIFLFAFIRCANVGQPTGGPKDLEPPKLLSTSPKDQSLNFNDNRITFTFDEYIKVEEAKKYIIITPPLDDEKYVLKPKNNVLTIQLKEKLAPNTTFSITLGEAVRDITEGNRAKNIKLGFSTGNYIDSISVSGNVIHALKATPIENAIVGLYEASDTLNLFDKRPMYFSKTDSIGNYQIDNIKNGQYRIYAFTDKNENLKNEPATESYGFRQEILNLDSSRQNVNLKLNKVDKNDLKIQSQRPDGLYFLIKFNKYVKDYELEPIEENIDLQHNLVEENKTIRVYNTFNKDSLEVKLLAKDTLNKEINEQFYIKFNPSKKAAENFSFSVLPAESDRVKENFKAEINFTKPVNKLLPDSIYFFYDSLNIHVLNPETDIEWNKRKDKLIIRKQLDKNLALNTITTDKTSGKGTRAPAGTASTDGSVKLYMGKGSFISVENDSSKLLERRYKFINPLELGSIEGKISTSYSNFFIQLIDKNFKIIDELENKKNYRFDNIKPGEYKIRVLIDNDGDGMWYPGDINTFKEPEDVYIFDEIITIRPNWEIKDINISF